MKHDHGSWMGSDGFANSRDSALVNRTVKVLLVDDQAIVGETIRQMIAEEKDVQFLHCADPSQAIATANAFQPTVILQDLVMPEIDGLMLVKFFRANSGTRQTPMIVLSSKEEPVVKAQAFALGANDYLVKLPDRLEVIARIRYHSRSYINLLERNEAYRQLEESRRQLSQEVSQAANYVRSLLPEKLVEPIRTDWRFVPSTQLGGDMFGYHRLDADHLGIYLLDVSGHGVGSSLLAVSAANLLTAQSLDRVDFRDPGKVLSRLNDVFPMEKQNGMFFTIWYGVYRCSDRTLAWSNAGHPPALLFTGADPRDAKLAKLASSGPGVGMIPEIEYQTEVSPLGAHARLLVYSDGVFEIAAQDGSVWSHGAFVGYVQKHAPAGERLMDQLLADVRQRRGSDLLADDFSILDIAF